MNGCWPNRMALSRLLTWQDGFQVELISGYLVCGWLLSSWMVVELVDSCRARVMTVVCDGRLSSLCDGVEHIQWHSSLCKEWQALMMVGKLMWWMLSSSDSVELAEFVQSSCEGCRSHSVLLILCLCKGVGLAQWRASLCDSGCGACTMVLSSHNGCWAAMS